MFNIKGIEDRVKIRYSDISDKNMRDLVRGQDIIFNLAGQVSHIESMNNPEDDLEINCRAQLGLLESCRENNRNVKIIYAGTRQIYGKPLYLPLDEKHLINPVDINGINKMAGESFHFLYGENYGIKTCSLRLTNTFGPRQLMKHGMQGFIPWFIRKAIDDEEITIYGGKQIRDMNYVDDVVDAFLLAAASDESNGEIFNLGGSPVSLEDFAKKIIEIGKKGRYSIADWPEGRKKIEIGDAYCSYNKIKSKLGWQPKTSLEDGLSKTIDFYKENKSKYWQ